MSVRLCAHLKEDGVLCSSPALRGRKYCYFHINLRGRHLKSAQARRSGANPPLELPFPEDMHAVQIALGEILWALADDRIDPKRAGLMLYTLQQASANLNATKEWNGQRQELESSTPSRAIAVPDVEQRLGLPPNTNLDADVLHEPDDDRNNDETLSPCHPERGRADQTAGAPSFAPSVDAKGGNETAPPCRPPQRVPLPADQARRLRMTEAEDLAYFLHCVNEDTCDDDPELLAEWLRDYRRRQRRQGKPEDTATPPPSTALPTTPEAA